MPRRGDACRHAFIGTSFDSARDAVACQAPRRRLAAGRAGRVGQGPVRRGRRSRPRAGSHRAGRRTRPPRPTARPWRACAPPARRSIGRTNMSEFAFSGVGINPHHGTPANAATADARRRRRASRAARPRAARCRWRPAPPGRRWARTPAARSAFRRRSRPGRLQEHRAAGAHRRRHSAVDHARHGLRDHALGARRRRCCTRCWRDGASHLTARPVSALRLAVPHDRDARRAGAHRRTRLRAHLVDAARLPAPRSRRSRCPTSANWPVKATGGFSAAESWAWHRRPAGQRRRALRPARGAAHPPRRAHERRATTSSCMQARRDWIARIEAALAGFDAVLSPTVPIVAPPHARRWSPSDDAFFATNALLLRNPSAVNLLDGCALSLPCQAAGRDAGRPDGVEPAHCATTPCSTSRWPSKRRSPPQRR